MDQEMHAPSDTVDHHHHYTTTTTTTTATTTTASTASTNVYPQHFHIYDTQASFLNQSESSSQRFAPTPDAFRTHDHHEAEHVYNSLPLTLDPSTLDLRSDYNLDQPVSSIGPNGSNSTTPTGSLRLHAYNPHDLTPSSLHGSKRRDTLGQLQIHIPPESLELPPPPQETSPLQDHPQDDSHQHQPSDMQGISIHAPDMHIHLEESHGQDMITSMGQEHSRDHDGGRAHNMYPVLEQHQSSFFMSSDAFANSPTNVSTPSDASPHSDLQAISPASTAMTSSSPPSILGRPFRSSSLSMGMNARPISLIPPPSPISPTHIHPPTLSTHPHMFPTPYFSSSNNSGSPGYPSTPATPHHTQGSSSSSHSSNHTRYSFRGSPVPHFTRGHSRSNSYGTMSTISARSSSPASSVTSGLTSLSGGPGSAPPSTAGPPTGSPMHFGECSDIQMSYGDGSSPPNLTSPGLHPRSQSHPPHSLSPAHSTLTYSTYMSNSRRSLPTQDGGAFSLPGGNGMMEVPSEPHPWSHRPEDFVPVSSAQRLTDEGFQNHYVPKPLGSRAPHRKQKLANSDRKAICLYARQHPSARQEDIAARYNVERSTISKILKNKERWLGCPDDDAKVARKRKPRFDDLELVLKQWVEDTRPQKIILSDALIRSKAKEEARKLGILEDKFKASSGWLENFKHRVGIRKGKYVGRDNIQEGGISDREESPSTKTASGRGPWSPDSDQSGKAAWHGDTKQEEALPSPAISLHPQDAIPDFHQDYEHGHIHGIQDYHGAVNQGDSKLVPGMRKTRSRTLAEAQQAQTSLSADGSSTSAGSSVASSLIDPTMQIGHSPQYAASFDGQSRPNPDSPSPPNSPGSASSSHGASVGLHAALDFIDAQPHGYATPEEVAVLKKLRQKITRPELHSPSSPPSLHHEWTATREA